MKLPYDETMGVREISRTSVGVTLEMEVDHSHHNPHGVLHGGVLCGLMDSAMGRLATERVGHCTNAEMQVRFLRPSVAGTLVATSRIVKEGRRALFLEAKVTKDGKELARGSSMFLVLAN